MSSHAEPAVERIVLDALGAALRAFPVDTPLAVAYSGGLDSAVLLDAAVRVAGASRCIALHVHHGLSPHADDWLAHCAARAHVLGVAFASRRVDLAAQTGLGIEAAARNARYAALEAMCAEHGAQSLWLAQHADDQAETVLLQLLRGAGLPGLAAMAPAGPPRNAPHTLPRVRPFLSLLRTQLERYGEARALEWVEDESNADTRYARNALRHDVMPALGAHFPGYREALARAAAHAASAQTLLDDLARIDWQRAALDEGRALSRDALLALDDARALNLLRYWMRVLELPVASSARLTDVLRQLREIDGHDHELRVEHGNQQLRCYRDRVCWEDKTLIDEGSDGPAHEDVECVWHGQAIWRLPQWRGTFVFSVADANDPDALPEPVLTRAPLVARARRGGERLRNVAGGTSRTLKNLFQEQGVPAWERGVPLLFSGDTLLFVPRIGANHGAIEAPLDRVPPVRWWRIEWREDLIVA